MLFLTTPLKKCENINVVYEICEFLLRQYLTEIIITKINACVDERRNGTNHRPQLPSLETKKKKGKLNSGRNKKIIKVRVEITGTVNSGKLKSKTVSLRTSVLLINFRLMRK